MVIQDYNPFEGRTVSGGGTSTGSYYIWTSDPPKCFVPKCETCIYKYSCKNAKLPTNTTTSTGDCYSTGKEQYAWTK